MQADRRAMASAALGISAVGAGVAASDHLTGYPVLTGQAVRYAAGAALLALVARAGGRAGGRTSGRAGDRTGRRREPRLARPDRLRLLALSASGMVLFNVAIVRAVASGEPAVVATIVGLAPVGLALAVPALERRRPSAGILGGAALAAAGAAVVEGFGHADAAALAWSVVALGCEVAFTLLAAPLLRTLSPLGLSVRASALASALLLALAVVLDGGAALAWPTAGEALAIGYLAVASTAVAFVLWYRAVARLGAERTGLFAGLMPVSAALVGAAVTPADLRVGTLVGTVLAGAGLAVGLRASGTRPARRTIRRPARRRLSVSAPTPGEGPTPDDTTDRFAVDRAPEPRGRPPGERLPAGGPTGG